MQKDTKLSGLPSVVEAGADMWIACIDAGVMKKLNVGHILAKVEAAPGPIEQGSVSTAELGGDITNAGKALLDDADAAAQRATLGLGNVDNTSDAAKPVSTAQQTALDAKQSTLVSGTNIKTINGSSVLGAGDLVISASDPSGYTTIVKPANQDVTNLGLTNDSVFSFAVVAGGHYAIDADLYISGNNTTGDFTMDFSLSAGTQKGRGTCQNLTAAEAVQNIIVTANAVANTTAIVTGTPADLDTLIAINIHYAFSCTNNGTLTFRFGNAAASAGRTSRVWKGSVLRYKRLD